MSGSTSELNTKTSYVSQSGQPAMKETFDTGFPFTDHRAIVCVADKWGVIDPTGQWIVKPKYLEMRPFSEGMAACKVGRNWGFINTAGEEVIKPDYYLVGNFSEGVSAAWRNGERGGYINKSGKFVLPPQYEHALNFHDGVASVGDYEVRNQRFIRKDGSIAFKATRTTNEDFSEGLLPSNFQRTYGYYDPTGKIAIAPRFDFADAFSEGLALVLEKGECAYIDKTGTVKIKLATPAEHQLYTGTRFKENRAFVRFADGWIGFIDGAGNRIIPFPKEGIYFCEFGTIVSPLGRDEEIQHKMKKALLEPSKEKVVAGDITSIGNFQNGLATVTQEVQTMEDGVISEETSIRLINDAGRNVYEKKFTRTFDEATMKELRKRAKETK